MNGEVPAPPEQQKNKRLAGIILGAIAAASGVAGAVLANYFDNDSPPSFEPVSIKGCPPDIFAMGPITEDGILRFRTQFETDDVVQVRQYNTRVTVTCENGGSSSGIRPGDL